MRTRTSTIFTTIRAEGGLLPASLLQRIADGDGDLTGLTPEDYHLIPGERLNEVINRSWNRALAAWESFRHAREHLPESDAGTTVTRERWLLPLFQELGYGRLQINRAIEIEGKSYPVSHFWEQTPIHLVSFKLDPDRRTPGAAGASRTSPHGLVQEFLNRSDDHLWAFLSNGLTLRILRDNVSLTRQAFVEFDLDAMMEGEVYADFAVLWLLCHQSRVEAPRLEECWLEKWCQYVQKQGIPALEKMRNGVEKAIASLGRGFISYPANRDLRDALYQGGLDKQEFYRQLLRVVYRLIFLFVAEDRDLLFHPDADPKARETYARFYSVSRLRRLAERRYGSKHVDLGRMLFLVFSRLGDDTGCPILGLPALGSFLWSADATAHLNGCDISNADLLAAIRELSFTQEGRVRRPVDYKNLGAEELGSIYESLLELHPEINADAGTFELTTAAGHERKTTGSYYTPTSLITCLLDSALDPVLDDACRKENPEQAILNLKVCDPACGSGHFLVAASHRIAKRLAAVRTGDDEPSPDAMRAALRDIIGHCIYGVDINPMSVELCKVSLWLESLEPGKPLSFLDHHIQCGNSLLGTTPALLKGGIPDDAFKPIEGDDANYCKKYKAINKQERKRKQMSLLAHDTKPWEQLGNLATSLVNLDGIDDANIAGIKEKQQRYAEFVRSSGYEYGQLLADAWCAAFVWQKREDENRSYPITEEIFRKIEYSPHSIPGWLKDEVKRLASHYRFFHWHLAFPDVFRVPDKGELPDNELTGWCGGFDLHIGNPPWERVKLQEEEFFASRNPLIANAKNAAARKKLIAELPETDPYLAQEWSTAVGIAGNESKFLRLSGRYPLGGVGDVNTYAVFADLFRQSINQRGIAALLLPNGLVTGFTYRAFLRHLLQSHTLASFYGFENEDKIFPDVHNETKFGIITMTGQLRPVIKPWFTAHLRQPHQVHDLLRRYSLTAEQIEAINPNTLNLPAFRWTSDAEVAAAIHAAAPVLIRRYDDGRVENPWQVNFRTLFHMANDSGLFLDHSDVGPLILERRGAMAILSDGRELYPLYEGKMLWHFDHRYGTYFGQTEKQSNKGVLPHVDDQAHNNPDFCIQPRYWVDSNNVNESLDNDAGREWLLAWRDVGPTERSFIISPIPKVGAGDTLYVLSSSLVPRMIAALCAIMSSLVLDYDARQKSNRMKYFVVEQLAVLHPNIVIESCSWIGIPVYEWLAIRTLELSYTNYEMSAFAYELECNTQPFRWNSERRATLKAEIDAAVMHLYQLTRTQAEWLIDSFAVLRKYEERDFGEFKTRRLVLEIYDAIAEAKRTGTQYVSSLIPPAADPSLCHSIQQFSDVYPFAISNVEYGNAYPGNDWERATCAFTLALVGNAEQDIDSLLTALILAANPDLCAKFLPENQQAQFRAIVASTPQALLASTQKQLDLRMLSTHLANLQAITRAPSRDRGEIIRTGSAFDQECINLSAASYQQLAGQVLTALTEFRSRSSQEVAKAELLQLKETMVRAAA